MRIIIYLTLVLFNINTTWSQCKYSIMERHFVDTVHQKQMLTMNYQGRTVNIFDTMQGTGIDLVPPTKGVADGEWIYYWHGRVWLQAFYKDGLLNGKVTNYYESGNISYETYYVNGAKNGVQTSYYDKESSIFESDTYRNDTLNGIAIGYAENGSKTSSYFYRNGLKNGPDSFWSGRLLLRVTEYANGKKSGHCYVWDYSSNLKEISYYKDDKYDGVVAFFVDGKIEQEMHYSNGSWYYSKTYVFDKPDFDLLIEAKTTNVISRKYYKKKDLVKEENYEIEEVDCTTKLKLIEKGK